MKILVVLIVARFVLATDESEHIYDTPAGCVKCSTEYIDDKPFRRCGNIKYAEVEERFGCPKPVAPSSSKDPINQDFSPICFQANNSMAEYSSEDLSENCLYLHVFVPLGGENKLLPVFFYIHGGSYEMGNGPKVPSKLLKQNVIVVTFNYRLSVFGFLSTGTCDCPGNAGIKDSLAALRWVNAHIAFFGGDPDNVIVYGLSAGAGMASFFPYIPGACGLFHKIILESGTINAPWSFNTQQRALENAKTVGQKVGCDVSDPKKLCSCLKTVSAINLLEASKGILGIFDTMNFYIYPWLPTAENPKCPCTILTQNPSNILSKCPACKVKIIIGVAQEESCIFKKEIVENKQYLTPLTAVAYKIAPQCLSGTNNVLCMAYVTKEIIAHYAKTDLVLNEKNIMRLISIVQFILPIMIYIKVMTKCGCEIYLYEFAYVGPCSVSRLMDPEGGLTCHGEQYKYLFPSPLTQLCDYFQGSPYDEIISETMIQLYGSFGKTGCPSLPGGPKWEPWTLKTQSYLRIGITLEIGYGLDNGEMSFWNNVQSKCFLDILGIILNPNAQNCCSSCPKDYTPCVL